MKIICCGDCGKVRWHESLCTVSESTMIVIVGVAMLLMGVAAGIRCFTHNFVAYVPLTAVGIGGALFYFLPESVKKRKQEKDSGGSGSVT